MDIQSIREDFPILSQEVHGHPLAYLDNAATTQVPTAVTAAIAEHYACDNANVHRGIHTLSERSTSKLEAARETVRRFINAASSDQIVFTSGATSAINMVARSWCAAQEPGTAVASTFMEHHANFVPWQQGCKAHGLDFRVCKLDGNGDLDLDHLAWLLEDGKVSLVAVTHVSNVLGTVNPLQQIIQLAHSKGAAVLVDAAQSIRHELVDVQQLDCDFLAFSGHKVLGPTGTGVLYGKVERLAQLAPSVFGGEMVDMVTSVDSTFSEAPLGFEAGTPNYVGVIALAAALEYLEGIGTEEVRAREAQLTAYAQQQLEQVPGLSILGSPRQRAGCISFTVENVHPYDLSSFVDKLGVALRSGNQCAQPLLNEAYSAGRVCRLSTAFYNTFEEIDAAVAALNRVIPLLQSAR